MTHPKLLWEICLVSFWESYSFRGERELSVEIHDIGCSWKSKSYPQKRNEYLREKGLRVKSSLSTAIRNWNIVIDTLLTKKVCMRFYHLC